MNFEVVLNVLNMGFRVKIFTVDKKNIHVLIYYI